MEVRLISEIREHAAGVSKAEPFPLPAVLYRPAATGDIDEISGWVSSSRELRLISGEKGERLSSSVLAAWMTSAVCSVIAALPNGDRVAFGTLSNTEARLPAGVAEICHLITHPAYRRSYHATCLILQLAAAARRLGFEALVARVVPSNAQALRLFGRDQRWTRSIADTGSLPREFVWFRRELTL